MPPPPTMEWVPSEPSTLQGLPHAVDCLRERRMVVLTGAGCSTESGIPDYRGPRQKERDAGSITFQEFTRSHEARRLYWARSMLGWPRFVEATPNPCHLALAHLEADGLVLGLLTQNVDQLHTAAGSRRVIELHGSMADVHCLDCGRPAPRPTLQQRLLELNPDWLAQVPRLAPDGDVLLERNVPPDFRIPHCEACGGILKPSIVFFGENLPRETTRDAWALWEEAEALLVVGSSLQVWSGYQFVKKAAARQLPVVIVNLGPTRGDPEADVRLHARVGDALPALARELLPPTHPGLAKPPPVR